MYSQQQKQKGKAKQTNKKQILKSVKENLMSEFNIRFNTAV